MGGELNETCLLVGSGAKANFAFAQTTYFDASLTGIYSISFNSIGGADLLASDGSGPAHGAVGTLQFDGKGNVRGGTITVHYGTSTCVVSLAGAYSIQSTGLGTITVRPLVTSGVCSASASWRSHIAVAQQGVSFSALNIGTAGSAAKQ